jgi:hypothetical protein
MTNCSVASSKKKNSYQSTADRPCPIMTRCQEREGLFIFRRTEMMHVPCTFTTALRSPAAGIGRSWEPDLWSLIRWASKLSDQLRSSSSDPPKMAKNPFSVAQTALRRSKHLLFVIFTSREATDFFFLAKNTEKSKSRFLLLEQHIGLPLIVCANSYQWFLLSLLAVVVIFRLVSFSASLLARRFGQSGSTEEGKTGPETIRPRNIFTRISDVILAIPTRLCRPIFRIAPFLNILVFLAILIADITFSFVS